MTRYFEVVGKHQAIMLDVSAYESLDALSALLKMQLKELTMEEYKKLFPRKEI